MFVKEQSPGYAGGKLKWAEISEPLPFVYDSDPDLIPPNLRRANQRLDRAVDRIYRPGGFATERERVEHLFELYENCVRRLRPR